MVSGYSGTPLAKKLGIKEGFRLAFVSAPAEFDALLGDLPKGVRHCGRDEDLLDLIVLFTDRRSELEGSFPDLAGRIQPAGSLWIAWPKRSSGRATDLTENVIREIGLRFGLVDNKICAISEIWSGLRFVYRLADRPAPRAADKGR